MRLEAARRNYVLGAPMSLLGQTPRCGPQDEHGGRAREFFSPVFFAARDHPARFRLPIESQTRLLHGPSPPAGAGRRAWP